MTEEYQGKHLIDSQLAPMIDLMPKEFTPDNLQVLRQPFPAMPLSEEVLAATDMARRTVPGLNGEPDVEVVIYRPKNLSANAPGILYFHGGGFLIGRATICVSEKGPLVM